MKSAKLDVRLHRCIVVSCDSVLMGNGGGPATIRPFGLDLEHLDDEVDEDEVDVAASDDPHNAANMDDDDDDSDSLDEAWSCPTAPPKLW